MGFSRQEYGVGCHFLLQGIFLTQGLNWGLLLYVFFGEMSIQVLSPYFEQIVCENDS